VSLDPGLDRRSRPQDPVGGRPLARRRLADRRAARARAEHPAGAPRGFPRLDRRRARRVHDRLAAQSRRVPDLHARREQAGSVSARDLHAACAHALLRSSPDHRPRRARHSKGPAMTLHPLPPTADNSLLADAGEGTRVEFRGITKSYGSTRVLHGVDLDIAPGEFVSLLGPSGCGKTTALRVLAGLEANDGGAVMLGGRDVSRVPTNKRDIGTVFQSYSLFPHLSVVENTAFGLR